MQFKWFSNTIFSATIAVVSKLIDSTKTRRQLQLHAGLCYVHDKAMPGLFGQRKRKKKRKKYRNCPVLEYLFLIIKYTVLGKCWLGHFSVQFSECIPKKRVSRRRTSVLGGTRNCTEKWPSQQVPRKGIFYDQNYIFSHADRVFFGSIWTHSNIRSLRVPLFYSSNPNLHKQSWWLRMLGRQSGDQKVEGSIPVPASCFFMLHTKCKLTSSMPNFLPLSNKLQWSNG